MYEDTEDKRIRDIKEKHYTVKRKRAEVFETIMLKRFKEQRRAILDALENQDLDEGIILKMSNVDNDTQRWFMEHGFIFEFHLPSEDHHSHWKLKIKP